MSTGAAGEEESEAAEDCAVEVTGMAGGEDDAEGDDIAEVKVGESSGSATTTALFVTSLFSLLGFLSS